MSITARLILRERVDFARQQPDRNRQNRAATVDSCFVLIGTRQHGVAVLYETSDRASSNKMQQNPCPIKFRTLNLPAPRITRCHIMCLREKADKASNSYLAKSTLSRSISLAVCVTIYFWLIRSLVDPTSTDSIIVRSPLQFSRLLRVLYYSPLVGMLGHHRIPSM